MTKNTLLKIIIITASFIIFKIAVENILGLSVNFPLLFPAYVGDPGFTPQTKHFSFVFYITTVLVINSAFYLLNLILILSKKIKASPILFIISIITNTVFYFLNSLFNP